MVSSYNNTQKVAVINAEFVAIVAVAIAVLL